MSDNRPARLNRTLLVLMGLVLLAGGAFVLLTHYGKLTVVDRDARLIPPMADPPTWSLYVAAAAAVLVGLLLLRWLLAQLVSKPKTHTWRMERNPALGRTELAASVAIAPFVDEVRTYHGVHGATATLAGTHDAPSVALVVTTEQDGDLTEIRHQIDTVGLPRLRAALDLEVLPVAVEFRFSTKPSVRAR